MTERKFTDGINRFPKPVCLENPEGNAHSESIIFIDRPKHLHMFPQNGGVHVSRVPRHVSGFRNWFESKE